MSTTNTTASSPRPAGFATGASTGSDAAIVRPFAADGARVNASARRIDRLARLAEEFGTSVLPLQLDVPDRASVRCSSMGQWVAER